MKTTDQHIYQLKKKGYTIISDLISKKECFYLKKKLEILYNNLKKNQSFIEYLAIRKMFNLKNIIYINCRVFDFNSSVISLHQKFGFKKIGLEKINKDNLISFMLSKKNWTKKILAIKAKLRV